MAVGGEREGVDGAGGVEGALGLDGGEAVEVDAGGREAEGEGAAVGGEGEGADAAGVEREEAVAVGAPDEGAARGGGGQGAAVGGCDERVDGAFVGEDARGGGGGDAGGEGREAAVAVDGGVRAAVRGDREGGEAAVGGARREGEGLRSGGELGDGDLGAGEGDDDGARGACDDRGALDVRPGEGLRGAGAPWVGEVPAELLRGGHDVERGALEGEGPDGAAARGQRRDEGAGARVEEDDAAVFQGDREEGAGGVEGEGDGGPGGAQGADFAGGGSVPEAHGAVVAGGREGVAVGGRGEGAHRAAVAGEVARGAGEGVDGADDTVEAGEDVGGVGGEGDREHGLARAEAEGGAEVGVEEDDLVVAADGEAVASGGPRDHGPGDEGGRARGELGADGEGGVVVGGAVPEGLRVGARPGEAGLDAGLDERARVGVPRLPGVEEELAGGGVVAGARGLGAAVDERVGVGAALLGGVEQLGRVPPAPPLGDDASVLLGDGARGDGGGPGIGAGAVGSLDAGDELERLGRSADRGEGADAQRPGGGRLGGAQVLRALEDAGGAVEATVVEERRGAIAELAGAHAALGGRADGGGAGCPHRRPAVAAGGGEDEGERDEAAGGHFEGEGIRVRRYSSIRTVAESTLGPPENGGTRALRNLRAMHAPRGVPAKGSSASA